MQISGTIAHQVDVTLHFHKLPHDLYALEVREALISKTLHDLDSCYCLISSPIHPSH